MSTGGPSHFLMATSAGLPMGTTGALPFQLLLLLSVTLCVVTSVHPLAVISLSVSNSNHTYTAVDK